MEPTETMCDDPDYRMGFDDAYGDATGGAL